MGCTRVKRRVDICIFYRPFLNIFIQAVILFYDFVRIFWGGGKVCMVEAATHFTAHQAWHIRRTKKNRLLRVEARNVGATVDAPRGRLRALL